MSNCLISKTIEFDAGHRVPNHISKCRNPHGHRYVVEVVCQGKIIEDPARADYGMLVDFGDLKTLMTDLIHDPLDHAMIIHEDDQILLDAMAGHDWKIIVFPYVPTAENFARWAAEQLAEPIRTRFQDDLKLHSVKIWETPTSLAIYECH